MKKTKRMLALVLSVLMLVAVMSACGGGTTATNPPANDAEGGTEATQAPQANEPAENNSGSEAGGAPMVGKNIFEEEIKIAFITLSTAGITNTMYQRATNEYLLMYPNVTITFFDAMYDINNQITYINEAVTQGFDAVIIECMDYEAANNAILEAEAAGVPVITYNVGASAPHSMHIEGFNYEAGEIAAKELAEATGGQGTAILLDVPAEQKAGARFGTGFSDYIKNNTDIEMLEEVAIANWSTENANTAMRDLLTKYDDITMVYGVSDDVAIGAVQAIEAAGRQDDGILVFGNMGYPFALEAIKGGRMYGTLFSDIYVQIQTTYSFALYFISSGVTAASAGYTETPVVGLSLIPVNPDNVDDAMNFSRWYAK